MVAVNLKALVSKLNDPCRRALEAAAGLTLSRTHYNVEIEHWLLKLLEQPDTDLQILIKHYEIDRSRLEQDLDRALQGLRTGNSRSPALSQQIVNWTRQAWLLTSLEYGESLTRSGHLLVAVISDDMLGSMVRGVSHEFEKIRPDNLKASLNQLVAESSESELAAAASSAESNTNENKPLGDPKTHSLDQFTVDLTGQAKAGKLDAVLGRDQEIRQMIDILTRRRQNNPILTGEAGVGKTAVVEGLALRVASGDVPDVLKNVSIRTLDLALLQAGAGVKGEFENRLKSVISEVKSSATPIVLFIDEAHTMIGAGGAAGQGDAANLLKPALARGELRTIAATTWAEYKKYFERDAALARRFQVVKIEEPSEADAIEIMRGLAASLESHHNVRILDSALIDSVKLSHRYISGRQLPDKSISVLDTACAKVALSQSTQPSQLEDCQRQITRLTTAIGILNKEVATGSDHTEELQLKQQELDTAEALQLALEERWKRESEMVSELRKLRAELEAVPEETKPADDESELNLEQSDDESSDELSPEERQQKLETLQGLTQQLEDLQGEAPLVQVCVDGQSVAEVISAWTGIPVGRMQSDEIKSVLNLKEEMKECIIGQSYALDTICERIRVSRAHLTDPRRPIGVFLFAGTSGVGKTETAITLANLLYGGDQNMTVINMSEFKEEHKVSLLMGSPPGYVGYGEGGVLTEAVRRKPYSVILLDEIEKAHPGVQDIFYQVFDQGMMKDGEGRDIDFKNTLIIMTSNVGTDTIMKLTSDPDTMPEPAGVAECLKEDLLTVFKPAFLGRLNVVPYLPLDDSSLQQIVKLQLKRIVDRVETQYRVPMTYSDDLVSGIAARCLEVDTGARNIDHIINKTILPTLSTEFLSRMADSKEIKSVHIGVDEQGEPQFSFEE